MHAGDPSSEAYVPFGHADGFVDFDAQNDPFGHNVVFVHPLESFRHCELYAPAGTSEHSTALSTLAYFPLGHSLHDVAWISLIPENFPGEHGVHFSNESDPRISPNRPGGHVVHPSFSADVPGFDPNNPNAHGWHTEEGLT